MTAVNIFHNDAIRLHITLLTLFDPIPCSTSNKLYIDRQGL